MGVEEYNEYKQMVMEGVSRSLGVPAVMPGEYRNPFNILDEFDEWFEFEKRHHFDKESTHKIIEAMLSHDVARAAKSFDANYTWCKQIANEHFGRAVFDNRTMAFTSS